MDTFVPLIAAFTTFLVAVGPAALADTRVVDFLRTRFDKDGTKPKDLWLVASGVVGVGMCLLFQLNFVGPIISAVPSLASQAPHLAGTWGQVLTGLGVMGASGYWHENLDQKSSAAKASRSDAAH